MTTLDASYMRMRKHYQKIPLSIDLPYLIEIQKNSYKKFLQMDVAPSKRKDMGLQGVFRSVFPVTDFSDNASVEFVEYSFDAPKYSEGQCRQRGMSFEAPLKVVIRLVIWEVDKSTDKKTIRDVKEQEVFFGAIPLMTDNGTFIINGIERVIVSQLHRSSGVFFDHDRGKGLSSGKLIYTARIIPYRGSWLDFEFDSKDILYVRIDRRRKLHATILLKALGYSSSDLLDIFYDKDEITYKKNDFYKKLNIDLMRGQKASQDFVDPASGKVIVKKNRRITVAMMKKLKELGIVELKLSDAELVGQVVAEAVVDKKTGEEIVPVNTELDELHVTAIIEAQVKKFKVLSIDGVNVDHTFRNTLMADKIADEGAREQAILEIYRRIRPGESPTIEPAEALFNGLFFDSSRYDLSNVGRAKLNERLGLEIDEDHRTLSREDIVQTVKILLDMKIRSEDGDDIDSLSNRRVRAVGELLENQYRIGVLRVERAIRERLQLSDVNILLPHDFINNKPASAVIKEFFGSSQLSQFMDQTNPLSEVTHKRRLSALGPGGLSRERAGFEVRDVHDTHYGRICPVETPEGPNIGLICSLASYARVNDNGFIETPYRNLSDNSVKYYSAAEEHRGHVITQASPKLKKGEKPGEYTVARRSWETETVRVEEADLSDVGAGQLISVAAALIPFLQNNDANRALMGSNMMRQAVPLIKTRAPLIGTGMEKVVARDSGATVVSKRDGVVMSVDAERIVVKTEEHVSDQALSEPESKPSKSDVVEVFDVGADVDIYTLKKYRRSNLDTCINQKPIVHVGDRVRSGDIIADGFGTEMGELALGQNVTVAFMPWNGYNFEDSILMSERVVKEDLYTSVHIQELECVARDTKLGQEEITCDIPNVGEEALKNLDESGVVVIGAEVRSGDILVGKITPKGETQLSPEEKLLRAVFGDKAGDVRDTSLRVPSGVKGTVIGAKIFSREGVEPDARSLMIQKEEAEKIRKDDADRIAIIKDSAMRQIMKLAGGMSVAENIYSASRALAKGRKLAVKSPADKPAKNTTTKAVTKAVKKIVKKKESKQGASKESVVVKKGEEITHELLEGMDINGWYQLSVKDATANRQLVHTLKNLKSKISQVKLSTNEQLARLLKGDELPPTVIKMVKVYVAIKRKLQVGDKVAGRHGNKGVVSMILPEEDMPYTSDGRPVDVVLNPLGVPSRMNVGQILETHLGWAAKNLGHQLNEVMKEAFSRPKLEKMCRAIWDTDDVQDDMEHFLSTATDDALKAFISKYHEGVHLANPVFDGVVEEEIQAALKLAGCAPDGKVELYDGKTGEMFANRVTVGVMYVLKLHHLVDEKIHARSIGPYSLVTQQPLGGKAQFGGQRLGEMEVWAMEAYGAANTLQEMLTVKSDDIMGRTQMYESIVKGTNKMAPGLPESFNVLIKELQSLGLDISLIKDEESSASATTT
ncbi:MAG: DNA-directed RNA polymerase subunit beta [Proteobacteria bacterium]|nr:DNA-directed RNA polymerase subunit beta [Pseudomonadota bacterium]